MSARLTFTVSVLAGLAWISSPVMAADELTPEEAQRLLLEKQRDWATQGDPLSGNQKAKPKLKQAARCAPGLVWRERFEGDSVCVPPDQRFKLANGTCRSGYVWRDSFPGDGVCVTPAQRAKAKAAAKP
jgi:hypothetical protein